MFNAKAGGHEEGMETIGNALEAECYSEASSAAFISLFLISITSLMYRAGDGDRTRDVQLGKMAVVKGGSPQARASVVSRA